MSAIGDPHYQPIDEEENYPGARANTLAWIAAANADTYLQANVPVGDLCYFGGLSPQSAAHDAFGQIASGLYVVCGNHEGAAAEKGIFKTLWGLNPLYYYADIGLIRLIVLDTNFDAAGNDASVQAGAIPPTQMTWLEGLLDVERPVVIAMHHYPQLAVWNPPPWFNEDDLNEFTALLLARAVAYPDYPTVVLSGHIHGVYRTKEMGGATIHALPIAADGAYYKLVVRKLHWRRYDVVLTAVSLV